MTQPSTPKTPDEEYEVSLRQFSPDMMEGRRRYMEIMIETLKNKPIKTEAMLRWIARLEHKLFLEYHTDRMKWK